MGRLVISGLGKRYTVRPASLLEEPDADGDELDDGLADGAEALEEERDDPVDDAGPVREVGSEFWALKDVSLVIEAGEKVGFIGANGSGKSTLLRIISGITLPTTGEVRGSGLVLSLSDVRSPIIPQSSGRKNIEMLSQILDVPPALAREAIEPAAALAELEPFLDRPVTQYSRGMYGKLAVAFALMLEPEILIADDSFMIGDAAFRDRMMSRLEEIVAGGSTVLIATHRMEQVERLCSRAIWLDQGLVRADGAPVDVVPRYLFEADGGEAEAAVLPIKGPEDGPPARSTDGPQPEVELQRVPVEDWEEANQKLSKRLKRVREKRAARRMRFRQPGRVRMRTGLAEGLGTVHRVRCLDEAGAETAEVLAGEALLTEIEIEAVKPGVQIDVVMALKRLGTAVVLSRLPSLFRAPAAGRFVFAVELDGSFTSQAVERHSFALDLWIAFYEPEEEPLGFDHDTEFVITQLPPGLGVQGLDGKAVELPPGFSPDSWDDVELPRRKIIIASTRVIVRGDIDSRFRRDEYRNQPKPPPMLRPGLSWTVEELVEAPADEADTTCKEAAV